MVWTALILASTVMLVGEGDATSDGFSCDMKDPPARLKDAVGRCMGEVVQEPREIVRRGGGLGAGFITCLT